MRILVVENFRETDLGLVGEAMGERGAEAVVVKPFLGDPLAEDHRGFDGLVVLGGAQSALDDEEHPYLPGLARLTRRFTEADKAVLGICLGSQLVARGAGADNLIGRGLEFAYRPIRLTAEADDDPVLSRVADGTALFHWHEDTVTLPEGAVHLAKSAMTPIQAFRLGRATYAIQFHFEAGSTLVRRWTRAFAPYFAETVPDWPARHEAEIARHGAAADAAGLAIAHAWLDLVR